MTTLKEWISDKIRFRLFRLFLILVLTPTTMVHCSNPESYTPRPPFDKFAIEMSEMFEIFIVWETEKTTMQREAATACRVTVRSEPQDANASGPPLLRCRRCAGPVASPGVVSGDPWRQGSLSRVQALTQSLSPITRRTTRRRASERRWCAAASQRTWIEGERVRVRVRVRVRAEAGVIEGRETWGCAQGGVLLPRQQPPYTVPHGPRRPAPREPALRLPPLT